MKKAVGQIGVITAIIIFVFAACGDNAGDPFFAVSGITGVPTSGTVGTELILSGTVAPDNATNRTIQWTVQNAGATGAVISGGNRLNVTAAGQVTVAATIVNGTARGTNFIDNFVITFRDQFIPVTEITDVPATGIVGTALALTGTVEPYYASNRTIQWTVQNAGATGASITGGNWLNATAEGEVTVTATIVNGTAIGTDFTEDFVITFSYGHAPFFPVTGITDVPETGTVGTELVLTGTVEPYYASNSAIQWTVQNAGATGTAITNENRLNVTAAGQVTVTATIVNGTAIGTNFTDDFVITFLPSLPSQGQTGIYGDFEWRMDESGITITGYLGPGGDVTIPPIIQGAPVTSIWGWATRTGTGTSFSFTGNGAFRNSQLTSVNIPDSVTHIGGFAFQENLLTSVDLPDGIIYIGSLAFNNNQISSVAIGSSSSVRTTGNRAFGCNRLTGVSIPGSVIHTGAGAFMNTQTISFNISDGVTYTGPTAFRDSRLESANTPGGVIVGAGAFSHNWPYLTSVIFHDNVTYIGDVAFFHNQINNSLTIGSSVQTIGAGAFAWNPIVDLIIPDSVNYIGSSAFSFLIRLTIGADVTLAPSAIGGGFEELYHNLGSIAATFARQNVSSNWVLAIYGFFWIENDGEVSITGLIDASQTDIIIPSLINGLPVTRIGHGVFENNGLTSVYIPNSVTYIEARAFTRNQLTGHLTISDSVTSIGAFAFASNQLESVTIGNGVTYIGDNAFTFNQINSLVIGNSVQTIGRTAFNRLQLASVIIPDSVVTIRDFAFAGHPIDFPNQLTSVTIGANVEIGRYFIYHHDNALRDVYNENGRQAGTLTRPTAESNDRNWTFTPR